MDQEIKSIYGGRVRTRVCGICVEEDRILLIKHKGLGEKGVLWAPPGGGVDYGSSVQANLVREFGEETGLTVQPEKFLFVYEHRDQPLHAVELFFRVKRTGGRLIKGFDPEMEEGNQIIESVQFVTFEQIKVMDKEILHGIFSLLEPEKVPIASGYFTNTDESRWQRT